METVILKAEEPTNAGGITIIPVVSFFSRSVETGNLGCCMVDRRPAYVIVQSQQGNRVLDMGGEEVPLERLLEEEPRLRDELPGVFSGTTDR